MMNATDGATLKPRILFITRAYPPIKGGMEQFSYDLTTSISARRHAVIIANRRGKKMLPVFVVIAFFRALYVLPHVDVIHIGDPVLSILAWALKKISRKPVVMSIHGLDILYPSPLYQRYLRMYIRSADIYVCISRHVEQQFRERFGAQKTVVITPGIQDIYLSSRATRNDLAQILKTSVEGKYVILTVGRLVPRKGVAWFVEHVLPALPANAIYAVVGDGPDRERILSTAQQHGMRDRVILTGPLPFEDLRVLYSTADVFVMPNIPKEHDAEGFGLVSLEAASCKLPVVAASVQGITDAIYDDKNGLLFDPASASQCINAIMCFLGDPSYASSFGSAARAFTLERFSWNVIAETYLTLFDRIAQR